MGELGTGSKLATGPNFESMELDAVERKANIKISFTELY